MTEAKQKLWFRAKSFGWGWVPISWQEGRKEKSNQEQRKDNN